MEGPPFRPTLRESLQYLEANVDWCAANSKETVFEKATDINIKKYDSMIRILTEAIVLATNGLRVTGDAVLLVSIIEGFAKCKLFTSWYH